jgi:hypothetical protein
MPGLILVAKNEWAFEDIKFDFQVGARGTVGIEIQNVKMSVCLHV